MEALSQYDEFRIVSAVSRSYFALMETAEYGVNEVFEGGGD
jgi:hypothetical protein